MAKQVEYVRPVASGRKSLLSPARARILVKAFRRGATEPEAAAVAGIGLRTLGRWLARGVTEASGPYCRLLMDCQEAIAVYRAELGRSDLDALFGVMPPEGARLWTSSDDE